LGKLVDKQKPENPSYQLNFLVILTTNIVSETVVLVYMYEKFCFVSVCIDCWMDGCLYRMQGRVFWMALPISM